MTPSLVQRSNVLFRRLWRQFMTWRRSFDVPPPPLADDAEWSQVGDERYADVPDADLPRTESLKLVIDRMLPYWESDITKDLAAGATYLYSIGLADGSSIEFSFGLR